MFKNYSKDITPKPGKTWVGLSETHRIDLINSELQKNSLYKDYDVIKAPENGQIEIKINKVVPANERAIQLLDLEDLLKSKIDNGITVWCDPVGDKSKLRKLRGVNIST